MDEILRIGVLSVASLAAALYLLGGFAVRVAGTWRDGKRRIELTQFGPWLRGTCNQPGGEESYSGSAFFGRIKLLRRARGAQYYREIGFSEQQIPKLQGRPLAVIRLRKTSANELRGEFQGFKFSFDTKRTQLRSVAPMPAEERAWVRES